MIATRTVFAWDAADDVEMPPISATPTAIPTAASAAACQLRNPDLLIWCPPFRCRLLHSCPAGSPNSTPSAAREDPSFLSPAGSRRRFRARPGASDARASGKRSVPNPHQPVRRDEHDQQEDDPDHGVERAAEERPAEPEEGEGEAPNVVLEDDEGERAEPRAFDPRQPADHGDHEQADRLGEVDVAGRDLPAPPDVQDAAQRGQERREP